MLITFLYTLIVFFALLLSTLILIRGTKRKTSWAFLVYALSSSLWLTGVFLDFTSESLLIHHFRLLFVFALVMALSLYVFIGSLVNEKIQKNTFYIGAIVSLVVGYMSIFSPFVTMSVERSDGLIIPDRGWFYPLAVAWIFFVAGYSIVRLVGMYRNASSYNKQQALIILTGYVMAFVLAMITTVVLPNFTGNNQYNDLSPFSSVLLTAFLAYAIIKHGFLDVRLIVVRSLGYLFLTLILASLYILLSIFVLENLLEIELDKREQLALFALVVIVVISIRYVQPLVNSFTHSVFYRSDYSPQEVIKRVVDLSVSGKDVDALSQSFIDELETVFRPSFSSLSIFDDQGEIYKVQGDDGLRVRQRLKLIEDIGSYSESLLVSDDLEDEGIDSSLDKLLRSLRSHNVSISVKLKNNQEVAGILLLGPKRSGSPYSQRDRQLIDTAVNEISLALQNAEKFEQIEKFNETLQKEIESATRKLQKSNEKLKALDEAKDEFISMASHQLRTPLTSIKGYISMVMEGDAGKISKQQAELLDQAFVSSQRMVYLIADLLNVSRLRTGKFVIDRGPTNVAELVAGEIGQLKETAAVRGLAIKYKKPKDFPEFNLDETKTRQVIMNFIDNAVYYTPKGGTITVDLKATRSKLTFTVTDTGIGVSKEDAPNLFTKFYRASNARKARPDGTGLGLYMARKVIVAQGGSIIFKSKHGKGSTFGFTLPTSKIKL
ncbi:MAG: ATP-binding protein [Patescibacteria group bacterium]